MKTSLEIDVGTAGSEWSSNSIHHPFFFPFKFFFFFFFGGGGGGEGAEGVGTFPFRMI